jgi:acyl carrier protein
MDILTRLRRIFRETFDDETLEVTASTGPDGLEGWDSVAQVKLVLAMEEEFGIRFDTEEVSGLKTVGEFASAIQTHLDQA